MPKVTADYFEMKRGEILDAAYRVCMSKPLHEVSMRDIIAESGWSQGRIYRYYSNIDDILISLINQRCKFYDVASEADSIIAEGACPESVIAELFLLWKKAFLDNLVGIGKIYYEITMRYANNPDKLKAFISKSTLSSEQNIFEQKSFQYVLQKIQEGYFTPKIPAADVIRLLITSLDGITRDLILRNYSGMMKEYYPAVAELDGYALIHSLCVSFLLLLGGNETLIDRGGFSGGQKNASETI